ncbi:MAG TPA: metal-sulfur cluster assembly factor [Chloroflexota bacterium]
MTQPGPAPAPVGAGSDATVSRLWAALADIEDPEIPVSVVDMGLIVSIDYAAALRTAHLRITFTAMGCPAMDMIQDDIRARLLREPGVEHVHIDVVWDPVWTPHRLSTSARSTMRGLGLSV